MDARRRKAFGRRLHGAGFSQTCGRYGASEQPHGIVLYRIPNADNNAYIHGDAHANAELDAHIHGNADAHAHPNPDAHAYAHSHRNRYAHAVGYRHRNAVTAYANSHAHGIRDAHPDSYPSAHGDAYAHVLIDADRRAHCVPNGCAIIDCNTNADGNSVAAIRNSAIGETGYAHAAAAYSHDSRPDRHCRYADSSHCDCSNAAANQCRAAADCARSGCRYRHNFVRRRRIASDHRHIHRDSRYRRLGRPCIDRDSAAIAMRRKRP